MLPPHTLSTCPAHAPSLAACHSLETELELVPEKRCIVFVNTKRQCDNVYAQLNDLGYRCTVLHGGRTQDQREVSIKGFR